eukprot:1766722-Heterocapsa_arctica.AAC.1
MKPHLAKLRTSPARRGSGSRRPPAHTLTLLSHPLTLFIHPLEHLVIIRGRQSAFREEYNGDSERSPL